MRVWIWQNRPPGEFEDMSDAELLGFPSERCALKARGPLSQRHTGFARLKASVSKLTFRLLHNRGIRLITELAVAPRLSDDEFGSGGIAVRVRVVPGVAIGLALLACAGRDPQPIASVEPQDAYSDCTMIRAEIEANNIKAKQLADEQGMKVAQNVAAGVVGVVIWPVWFGMDFKDAAGKEVAALQARQEYLTILAGERCTGRPLPSPPPGALPPPTQPTQ